MAHSLIPLYFKYPFIIINKRIRWICAGLIFFIIGFTNTAAQNYAIQSTVMVNPPYTLSLPQYASDPQRFSVQLINKDFATPLVEVFAQLRIDGPGITLETKGNYRPAIPISLTAGIPVILNGTDLSDLFNANNLNFEGLNLQQFLAGGSYLPEGLYRFSVVVKTYHQNLQISNIGYATAGIFKNLPPILNLPQDRSFIALQNPQYLQIQFTPRHTITSELIGRVRYKIRLTEIMPASRNPNEAMLSTVLPFFETITDQTSFIYGPGEPSLVEGRAYAIQVQAIDVDGKNLFDNNGYSQVISFVYGGECPIPQNLLISAGDGSNIDLKWDENNRFRSYMVYYRIKGQKYFKSELAFSNIYSIQPCIPDVEYEIKISGVCSYNESETTPLVVFKTINKESDYRKFAKNCGKPLPSIDLSNKSPLLSLQSGDVIKAADFEVKVTSANGNNGNYSGTGFVNLPFTGNVPLPCTFEHIFLNTDKRLINGKISLLKQPLELSNRSIVNVANNWRTLFGDHWNRFTKLQYSGTILSVKEDPTGEITIKGSEGEQKVPKGSNIKITDANGKSWYISSGGKVSEAEGPSTRPIVKNIETGEGTPNTLPPGMAKLFFYTEAKDGYDAIELTQLTAGKTYDQLESEDTGYYAGWKLAKAGEKFEINAIFTQGKKLSCPLDSIHFVRSDGTILPFSRKGNEFIITATGRMHLYAEAIWAVANFSLSAKSPSERWILGKLNIINVDIKKQNIVLIPVNTIGSNADAALIQSSMNQFFDDYGIQTSIKKHNNLQVKSYNEENEVSEADKTIINLGYSEKLKRFIEAFKSGKPYLQNNANNDTCYLFLLNKSTEQTKGFMGPGEQYGFIFLNNEKVPDIHTIAHEICHGAYRMEHVFGSDISKSAKSQNLLDYAAPYTLLNYNQWMQIHDPEIKINAFGKEDKGKYISINQISQFKELANEDGSYTFISHSGEYITLPATTENLIFSTLNRGYFELENGLRKSGDKLFPMGCLTAFKINSTDYHALEKVGYVNNIQEVYMSQYESFKFDAGIMVYATFSNNTITGKAAKFVSHLKQKSNTRTGGGSLLKSFAVIDFETASLNTDFTTYMAGKRKGEKQIEKLSMNFGIFGNDGIEFQFRDTNYNASKFLVKILSEQKTVSDYLYYFNLVNLRNQDYYSFVQCLNDKMNQKAIQISHAFIAKRNTEKGEFTAVTKFVNENSENMFTEIYKVQMKELVGYAQNGSSLSKNIKKAKSEKWKPEFLFEHLKTSNYPKCHYAALELEDRIYTINSLIANRDYWQYGDINLITYLLSTTPTYDAKEIMKKGVMANKFNWLFQMWYNRDEVDISANFETINNWLYEHYDALEIIPSKGKLIAEDLPSLALNYEKNQDEFLIGIKDKTVNLEIVPQKFSIFCNGTIGREGHYYNSNPGKVVFKLDGTISFSQTYRVDDLRPQLYHPQRPPKLQSIVDYDENFNPLELISVTVGGNYFGLGIKAGQTLDMPAFMAMQMQEKLAQQEEDEQIKKLINTAIIGVSLVTAAYTDGASLNVASSLLMATLTADNAITDYKSNIKTQSAWEANKEFFNEWDALNTAAQYALAIEDVYSLGKMVLPKVGGRVSFIKSWNKFRKYCKSKILKKEVTAIIDEIATNTFKTEFKAGDEIAGVIIDRVKPGKNGKIALIGRGMGDGKMKGVKDVYTYLVEKGYTNVEVFDGISLKGEWKIDIIDAIEDMEKLKDIAKISGKNKLDDTELILSKLFKLDEAWMDMIIKEEYTIIDLGDLYLKAGIEKAESLYYNMEKLKAFGI